MIGVFVVFSRIFLLGILNFKGLTVRRLYKSFGVKGLNTTLIWLVLCSAEIYQTEYNKSL
jgi:hypothetical protein